MQKLSTKPLKGFRDFTPEDWSVQKYIFDRWRTVCEKNGYLEYNGPVLEPAEIYNKSGDDIGSSGKELYLFEDNGGRRVVLRPEMTPTVGRMIADNSKKYSKPIRWYSIAQFFRAENPQRGRGREFFQLNFDIFGATSIYADVEILKMAIDILLEFGADETMFVLLLNNRRYMNASLKRILDNDELLLPVIRTIDRLKKIGEQGVSDQLKVIGLSDSQVEDVFAFIKGGEDRLNEDMDVDGAEDLLKIIELLKDTKYSKYIKFTPSLARGFDYYTGTVFEVFDNNPQNNRSMFGGGRYDNLVDMFSNEKIAAVGCAPGDVPIRLFLESWDLLPKLSDNELERWYLPILLSDSYKYLLNLADNLRKKGVCVIMGSDIENVSKALSYANKNKINNILILGEEELKNKKYKVKNMETGEEQVVNLI